MADDQPEPRRPRRPELTVRQAAEAAGVSMDTIRRRLREGRLEGAHKTPGGPGRASGQWMIPVEALQQAGLPLHRPADPEAAAAERAEVDRLRAELAEQRRRADVAEAELSARREQISDLRRARLVRFPPPRSVTRTDDGRETVVT